MRRFPATIFPGREDSLRLLALGRVPRCGGCPRYHSLVAGHAAPQRPRRSLPRVPDGCSYQFCAPLAVRFEETSSASASPGGRLSVTASG